eukprot:141512-Prymnesium_polylepis.1
MRGPPRASTPPAPRPVRTPGELVQLCSRGPCARVTPAQAARCLCRAPGPDGASGDCNRRVRQRTASRSSARAVTARAVTARAVAARAPSPRAAAMS